MAISVTATMPIRTAPTHPNVVPDIRELSPTQRAKAIAMMIPRDNQDVRGISM
jgi:hypothetical protein